MKLGMEGILADRPDRICEFFSSGMEIYGRNLSRVYMTGMKSTMPAVIELDGAGQLFSTSSLCLKSGRSEPSRSLLGPPKCQSPQNLVFSLVVLDQSC